MVVGSAHERTTIAVRVFGGQVGEPTDRREGGGGARRCFRAAWVPGAVGERLRAGWRRAGERGDAGGGRGLVRHDGYVPVAEARGGGDGRRGADVFVQTDAPLQAIEGFGACFNELGWTSLAALSAADRDVVLRELFAPGVGANFTLCRMPVGANDFSRDWYSYDETAGDFALEHFTIANDLETLVPFIKAAHSTSPP